jgi:hypothetical protein
MRDALQAGIYARRRAALAVNHVMTTTYCEIGRRIFLHLLDCLVQHTTCYIALAPWPSGVAGFTFTAGTIR